MTTELRNSGSRRRDERTDDTVRLTVDLSADSHQDLRRFAVEARASVSCVVRALVAELEDDPKLARRIARVIDSNYE
jgi:hypothetical protein